MSIALRVLLVEDSESDAALVVRRLEQAGDAGLRGEPEGVAYTLQWHRVETAEAMREALNAQSWDVVISDFSLPQFGALSALELLRAANFDYPFVVVSGTIGEEKAVELMRAGAQDFLSKDRLARLPSIVRREISDADLRRQLRASQAEIKKGLERYTNLYDFAPVGYVSVDGAGAITQVNLTAAMMLGAERSYLLGTALYDYVVAADQTVLRDCIAVIKGSPFQNFIQNIFEPNVLRSCSVSLRPGRNNHSTIARIEGTRSPDGREVNLVLSDVTQLVESRKQAWRAQKEWEISVDAVPELIVVTDDRGVIVRCNEATTRLLNMPYLGIIGRLISDVFGAELLRRAKAVQKDEPDYEIEFNGRKLAVQRCHVTPEHGAGFVFVLWDITERKRAEIALLESRRLTQTTLDALAANICVIDAEGVIVAVNTSWRNFGIDNGANLDQICEGNNYLELCDGIGATDAAEARALALGLREILAGKRDSFQLEYACHSPTEQRWFEVHVTPSRIEGKGFMVLAHQNITERRLAELALRESAWTLHTLTEGTTAVGADFFQSLVQQIAVAMDVKYVYVGELTGTATQRIRTLAMWADVCQSGNREYALAGTACETVVGQKLRHYERDVAKMFPDDTVLVEMGVQSYIGIPLFGSQRQSLGLLAVLHDHPMPRNQAMESILEIFAARAGAELERIQIEEALKKNEKSLNDAQSIAKIGSWEFDLRTSELRWSPETYRIFELENTPADKLYAAYRARIYPEDIARLDQAIDDAIAHGKGFVYEHCITAVDGSIKCLLGTGQVMFDDRGIPTTVIGTCQDITARKKTEAELSSSNERWRFALEGSGDGVWDYDVESGAIAFSSRLREILGYSDSDPFATNIETWMQQYVHPDDVAGLIADFSSQIRQDGLAQLFNNEHRLRCKNGTYKWCLNRGKVVASNAMGAPSRIIGTIHDITHRKVAADLLEQNARFMRGVADNMPGLLAYWTHSLNCTFANQHYLDWYGLDADVMRALPMDQVLDDAQMQAYMPYVQGVLQGEVQRFEYSFAKPNGEPGYLWTQLIPDYAGDDVSGFFLLATDISELKQAQEVALDAHRLRTMSELASGASHDLNNILQGIGLNVELSRINSGNIPELESNLATIQQLVADAAQRIKALHGVKSKKSHATEYGLVDSGVLIQNVINQIGPLVRSTEERLGVQIQLVREKQYSTAIPGNMSELRAAFYNIIKNSIEAMPHGGTIGVSVNAHPEGVVFSVSDTGIGMNMEDARRIFEPFHTTKSDAGGQGLGMVSVRAIVQAHQGMIRVAHTEPGRGTTIEVVLPAVIVDNETSSRSVPETKEPMRSLKVLWVDDNMEVVRSAPRILAALGCTGDAVDSARKALELLQAHSYDAVVTDIGMPEMNGWELIAHIRKAYGNKMKILVVSGWGERSRDMDRPANAEADAIIAKPVEVAALGKVLRGLFG